MSSTGSEGEAENIQLPDDTLRNEFVEPEYVDYSGDFITDKQWSDREEMIKWARGVGWKRNMTIVIMKSWKASKSRGAKVLLSCEKSGERRSGKRFLGIGEVQTWISRKGNTKKTNCPFVLEGCEISPSAWRLSIRCGRHNHDLPPGLEGHAFEGRLKPKEYEEVRKLSKAGARPTAVLKAIRDEPEASEPNYTSRQQIYNAKAKQRREARGGMSEIQYLFSMMVKKKYSFNYRLSPEGNWIQDLVFAHPESLKFWEIFPYTMIIDATYHTNKYHMPLCEIVGMTCSGKTFNIAFAFMRNELYDNYAWVFQQLAGWIKGRPTVIVTDRDKSILKAIPDVFPDAHHMLCLLHIERNIESRALDVTNSKSETYKFQRASMKLINSPTYAEFIQQLECMKGVYGNKWHLMDYLETTLVNPHASKILRCWTDHYLHFDNKTTNRVESAHSVLKQNVNSATGGFDTVFEHIDRMLEDQIRNVKTSLEYSRNNVPMELKNEGMFVVIEQRVSLKCLEELLAILTEARSGNYTEECNDWWRRTTLGLPCVHEVVRIIQENRVFYPEDVHPFWRQVNWDRPLLEDVPIGISMHDVVLRKFYKDYEDGSVAEHNIRQVSNLLMAINEPQSVPFKDPPPLEAKKGRPKKPPGGRERSAFEHARENYSKAKEAREKKKKASEASKENKKKPLENRQERAASVIDIDSLPDDFESGSQRLSAELPHIIVRDFDFGRGNFEKFMCIHVQFVKDVAKDGNCGFRALAELLGMGEDKWHLIRRQLYDEVAYNEGRYAPLIQYYGETVSQFKRRLSWQILGIPAPVEHWMEMPLCGIVFATLFQCTLVFLDFDAAVTCLPLTRQSSPPPHLPPGQVLVLCRLRTELHYVALKLGGEDFPMPPIAYLWTYYHDASVEGMELQYASRIELFHYNRLMDGRPPPH